MSSSNSTTPVVRPLRKPSGGGVVAVVLLTFVVAAIAVGLLFRSDPLTVILFIGVLLAVLWTVASLRSPLVATWGLLLWVPVQGWFQLNVFDNANWSVVLCDLQTALVYGAVFVQWAQYPKRWRPPAVFLFAIPFALWFLVLVPYSISRLGWLMTAIALRTYVFPLGLLVVGFRLFRSVRQIANLAVVLMLQMVFISILSVAQLREWMPKNGEFSAVPPGFVIAGVVRPPGTFSQAGHLGMYVLAMILLGVGFVSLDAMRGWRRVASVAGLVGAGVALAVNTQRSAIMIIALVLPLVFVLARRLTFRNALYAAIVASLVVVAGSIFTAGGLSRRVVSIRNNIHLALIEAPRDRMLQALEAPLVGRGLGSASPGTERLRVAVDVSAESYMAALVFEGGVPALIFYYGLLLAILWFGYRVIARCRTRDLKLMAAAIVGYQVAIWLQSWTYDPLHHLPNRLIFWFWVGVLLALPRLENIALGTKTAPRAMRSIT